MTTFSTIVSTSDLAQHVDNPRWVIVDCRFSLDDPARGRRDYLQAHIPGAVYAHLDEDLSGTIVPGKTSRHPLPAVDAFAQTLGAWGIAADVQVVAYDDNTGVIAARLWWMLRWMGHDAVAVLNGGWKQWREQSRESRAEVETRGPRTFLAQPRPELLVDVDVVMTVKQNADHRLVDARSAERYRGEHEPIDPVAGHIPGALCAPYMDNVDAHGLLHPTEALRARFEAVLGAVPTTNAIFYCGSGVSAAHNLLAMAHAGLGDARLYAGSWSEWITDSTRPISVGEEE